MRENFSLPRIRGKERNDSKPKEGEGKFPLSGKRAARGAALREEQLPQAFSQPAALLSPLIRKTHRPAPPHPPHTQHRSPKLLPQEGRCPLAPRAGQSRAAPAGDGSSHGTPRPTRGPNTGGTACHFSAPPAAGPAPPRSGTAAYLLDGEELQQGEDQVPVQEVRDLGGEVVLRHLGHGRERSGAGPGGARRGRPQPRVLTGCAPARPRPRRRGPPERRRRVRARGGCVAVGGCGSGRWFRGARRRDAEGASAGSDGGFCCVGVRGTAGMSLELASLALLEAAVGPGRVCGAVGPGPCPRPQPCPYLVWVKALV